MTWRQRGWLRHAALPAAMFGVALAAVYGFSLDQAVADYFYDSGHHRWYYGKSWWANGLIHNGGNALVKLTAVVCALTWLLGWWRPAWRHWQRTAAYALLVIGLATGLVALGKQVTNLHCPRDLSLYGGEQPLVHLWDSRPAAMPRGKCFPGGHSSGGFSFLSLYFIFLKKPGWARYGGLAMGLVLGTLFALGQWVRGAHFPSHDLWSAAVCWLVALMLYEWAFRGRLR